MGNCIICGTPVDGHICSSHEEDALFTFEGNSPEQLTPGRYYEGTVDGYAEFGVFVDVGDHVTGLLHRSELDQRLESLDWETGDTVYVQVTDVRDNGNVDLGWSIRQREREFRGHLVDTPQGDELPPEEASDDGVDAGGSPSEHGSRTASTETRTPSDADATPEPTTTDESAQAPSEGEATSSDSTADAPAEVDGESDGSATIEVTTPTDADAGPGTDADAEDTDAVAENTDVGEDERDAETDEEPPIPATTAEAATDTEATSAGETAASSESTSASAGAAASADVQSDEDRAASRELSRGTIDSLDDTVGQVVRIEGEVVSIRQTSGPTVFEVRDETGVVEAAAFESAGVRAYPAVEVDDVVRIDGEVERHHGDLQVETEVLEVLAGDAADAVSERLEDALAAEADPGDVDLLGDEPAVAALEPAVRDVATTIREAVFTGRPVVVRHTATADGYAAGAAIERAVLPLVGEEHAREDAAYHFFERRPFDDAFYGMDEATDDVTDMLEDNERHGEQFPLVVLVDTGSTRESAEGYDFLDVYDVECAVVDTTHPDADVLADRSAVVNPHLDGDGDGLTTTALAANVAAFVNDDVRDDLRHLPAVSYWEDAPASYLSLAADADYDEADLREQREAMALEAFYQSYKDKRELVEDILFGRREGLAGHVSNQFREKLSTETATARNNLSTRTAEGVTFAVIDTDAFTHRFDFPPAELLLDALHRDLRDEHDEPVVTIGMGSDDLHVRSETDVDVRDVAERAESAVPEAGLEVVGGRDGHLEYLAGERNAVMNAVVSAIAKSFKPE